MAVSIVVVAAALMCLVCQQVSSAGLDNHPRTGYACEGDTLDIECQDGYLIRVLRCIYGRDDPEMCNADNADTSNWVTQCYSLRSLTIVSDRCDDKRVCHIPASNRLFGDPCHNTPKYLEVQFRCVSANPPTRPTTTMAATTTTTPTTTSTTTAPTTTTPSTTTPEAVSTPENIRLPTQLPVHQCLAETKREIAWPQTAAAAMAVMPCPDSLKGEASWTCGSAGHWMAEPDLSQCVSPQVTNLQVKMATAEQDRSPEIVEEVALELAHVTPQYGGDVSEMTRLMTDVVHNIELIVEDPTQPNNVELVEHVQQAVVNTSNELLAEGSNQAWLDLPQATQSTTATNLVSAVEKSAFQLAKEVKEPTIVVNVQVNIVVQINVISTQDGDVTGLTFPSPEPKAVATAAEKGWGNGNSICLSGNTLKELGSDGMAKVVFATYKNLEQFLHPPAQDGTPYDGDKRPSGSGGFQGHDAGINDIEVEMHEMDEEKADFYDDKNAGKTENDATEDTSTEKVEEKEEEEEEKNATRIVNTQIISASVNGRKEQTELSEPVTYTLEHNTAKNVFNPSCSFWEISEKTMNGKWSDVGCRIVDTNTTHTVCSCNHLTNFAVLMDVSGTKLEAHHEFALSLITYAGCIISIICLILAWLTFQFFKSLQCDRNTIHKNLVLCLLVGEILFLGGIVQYDKPILCSVIAVLLHYFFLAAFSWMCLEGIQLYMMLIEVFEAEKSRVKYYYLAAYGIPAIIVLITVAIDHTGYGTSTHCWLTVDNGMIWAFVGPVVAVITVNIVMLSIAIYMMCKHAATAANWKMKEKSRLENIRSWLKGAVVLVVLLGLTWMFGLLYVNAHTVTMAYIFTVLNTLQGVFIFVFHCLMNDKVQKEYKKTCRHNSWLPECIRVNYGGANRRASYTPNQSTSSGNYLSKLLSGRRRKRSSTTTLSKSTSNASKYKSPLTRLELLNNSNRLSDPSLPLNGSIMPSETEDPEGYLEPCKIRIDDSYCDFDGHQGELSMIEGSVVDSNYLDDYCKKGGGMAIDVDKYKIKEPTKRLSALSQEKDGESEFSDGELFRMTDKEKRLSEYEPQPLLTKTASEEMLVNNVGNNDTLQKNKLKRVSSDSICKDDPSLNDLNKDGMDSSKETMYLSTPNINIKPGCSSTQEPSLGQRDSPLQRSLPLLPSADVPEDVAIKKLKKALVANDDGLVQVYHGKSSLKRLSSESELALSQHKLRLTSSDC